MRKACPSRRQFGVTAASAVFTLCVTRSSVANQQPSTDLVDCAVVEMRQPTRTQARKPLAAKEIIRRMCQLMDECAQWGAQADIMVFPNLENLTLTEGGPEFEALKGKARALGTSLSFECSLAIKGGGPKPASILIDSKTGLTTHLKDHTARTLKQIDAASPSAPHDHIRYVQLPAAGMRSAKKPMDSFAGLAG